MVLDERTWSLLFSFIFTSLSPYRLFNYDYYVFPPPLLPLFVPVNRPRPGL